jgi:hypothetical protein
MATSRSVTLVTCVTLVGGGCIGIVGAILGKEFRGRDFGRGRFFLQGNSAFLREQDLGVIFNFFLDGISAPAFLREPDL